MQSKRCGESRLSRPFDTSFRYAITTTGAKQLEQHTKSMQAAIPGLFSAIRFVGYIRQQVNSELGSERDTYNAHNERLFACAAHRKVVWTPSARLLGTTGHDVA